MCKEPADLWFAHYKPVHVITKADITRNIAIYQNKILHLQCLLAGEYKYRVSSEDRTKLSQKNTQNIIRHIFRNVRVSPLVRHLFPRIYCEAADQLHPRAWGGGEEGGRMTGKLTCNMAEQVVHAERHSPCLLGEQSVDEGKRCVSISPDTFCCHFYSNFRQ